MNSNGNNGNNVSNNVIIITLSYIIQSGQWRMKANQ
jgi:hypothetical protein